MLPTSQPPVMESPAPDIKQLNNSKVRISKNMSMVLEGKFMDSKNLKMVCFVLENHFRKFLNFFRF